MKIAFKSIFLLAISIIGLTSVTSCDDDNDPKTPELTDVIGQYSGKVYYEKIEAEAQLAKNIAGEEKPNLVAEAEIKGDTIYIKKFPVEAFVKTIITDEEQANQLIEKIGDIDYKMSYKSAFNATQDSINMTLNPESIELTLPVNEENEMNVTVNIVVTKEGVYEVKNKKLDFGLKASVPSFLPDGFSLSFKLAKK